MASITELMDASQKTGRQVKTRQSRGYPPYQGDLEEGEDGEYGDDEERLIQLLVKLAERWRPPETFSEKAAGLRAAEDPAGWAIKQGEASRLKRSADPWGPGGLFEGRGAADRFTPEQIAASQGNTAENQWAQRGTAMNKPSVVPKELQQNLEASAESYRNASPSQKASAKRQYATALHKKSVAARGLKPGSGRSRAMYETGAIPVSQAFGGSPVVGNQVAQMTPEEFERLTALSRRTYV